MKCPKAAAWYVRYQLKELKMRVLLKGVALLFIPPLSGIGVVQSRKTVSSPPKIGQTSAPSAKTCFDNVAFDDSPSEVKELPPNFCGVDVEALIKAAEKSTLLVEKSEFESTAKYQERLASFARQPILGKLKPADTFAVVLKQKADPGVGGSLRIAYDADAEKFQITIRLTSAKLYLVAGSPDVKKLIIKTSIYDQREYEAGNAMGAKVNVKELDSDTYALAISEHNPLFIGGPGYQLTYSIAVPPEQARELKPLLAVALIGNMVDPWYGHDIFGHDPTVDDPYKILDNQHLIFFDPARVIIFRTDNGGVIPRHLE